MDKDYFVMLNTQSGGCAPMLDETEELAMFDSVMVACDSAQNNVLGRHFGFEVFAIGEGVHQG